MTTAIRRDACKLVEKQVPNEFLRELVFSLAPAYRDAHERAFADYERSEAVNVLPFMRRANVEKAFRTAAVKHGLKASTEQSSGGWNYTLVQAGDLLITQAAAPNEYHVVHQALYRLTLAKNNWMLDRQLHMYLCEEPQKVDSFYAIFLHGKQEDDPSKPAFAHLVFPDVNCRNYVEYINLLSLCDIKGNGWLNTIPEEAIPDLSQPQLLPGIHRNKNGAEK